MVYANTIRSLKNTGEIGVALTAEGVTVAEKQETRLFPLLSRVLVFFDRLDELLTCLLRYGSTYRQHHLGWLDLCIGGSCSLRVFPECFRIMMLHSYCTDHTHLIFFIILSCFFVLCSFVFPPIPRPAPTLYVFILCIGLSGIFSYCQLCLSPLYDRPTPAMASHFSVSNTPRCDRADAMTYLIIFLAYWSFRQRRWWQIRGFYSLDDPEYEE